MVTGRMGETLIHEKEGGKRQRKQIEENDSRKKIQSYREA